MASVEQDLKDLASNTISSGTTSLGNLTKTAWDTVTNGLGFGANTTALGGETLSTFSAGPGAADIIAPTATGAPGFGATLAGAGFAALASFVASKIYTSFTEDNPALAFQGGTDARKIPMVIGSGRDESGSNASIQTSAPTWTSDKFEFGIAVQDIPEGEKVAEMVGGYFDNVFTEMQSNTDVDINKIIEFGIDLTDWENGGVEAMVGGVIEKVASGIQTGQPLLPYYASKMGANGQLVDGLEDYGSALDMTGRDGFDAQNNGQIKKRLTYTPIEKIQGDTSFTMPDISGVSLAGTSNGSITDADGTVFNADGTTTNKDGSTMTNTTEVDQETTEVDQGLWKSFLDRATTDLEGLIQENADYTAAESTKTVNSVSEANEANTKVLEQLTQDLTNQQGTFTPTKTTWGTYQPGTNFINAKSLMSLADQIKANSLNTTEATYNTISDRAPNNGALTFLESLQGIAEKDKEYALDKYRADLGLASTQYASDTNAANTAANIQANEPSTLSNIVSTVNAGKGLWDLGSSIYNAF